MEKIFQEIREEKHLVKIILSAPAKKGPSLPAKISLRKITKNGIASFSAEETVGNKAFHKTLSEEEMPLFVAEKLKELSFRQLGIFTEEKEISYRFSKKGKIARSVNTKNKATPQNTGHNREKNYLIREGDAVDFMVDLGVFTKDYKPVQSKYDKFRQINRFIEIVDHAFSDYEKDEISILDFGCGKSRARR